MNKEIVVLIICELFIALLVLLVNGQRPNCWRYYQDDPENIDQVYFPHEKNCQFFYQCTAHGAMR